MVDFEKFAYLAVIAAFVGGVTSVILSMLLASVSGGLVMAFVGALAGAAILYVSKWTDADALKVTEWVALFTFITFVGTVVSMFVPQVASYILSVNNAQISGGVLTFLYVLVADAIADKFL